MRYYTTKYVEKQLAKIKRVNELHEKIQGPHDNYICKHCTMLINNPDAEVYVDYPCWTIEYMESIGLER